MAPTRSSTKISRAAKTETKRSAVRESSQEHDRDANDSQASQISDDLDVAKMIQGMMKSTKKRHEARRATIRQEHKKQVERVEEDIRADTISRSESHETRLEKLSALLARKASVEASIMAHTRAMEKAYVETIKEVTVIIAGRTQDLVAEPA
ncbi:hypothetical protein MMC08_005931 [Hypocenomyce scalaris]|nr:hypothetical protein [Hypocenomyce scalaris]